MKKGLWFSIIISCMLLVSCGLIRCNNDLLYEVINTPVTGLSDAITLGRSAEGVFALNSLLNSYSVPSKKWVIKSKGSGCLVSLTAEKDGKRVNVIDFFVDLKKNEVFPRNVLAEAVFAGVTLSGDVSGSGGLPIR